jgi:uncharacterized protein YlzI (FlbEa/FlbD family)
MNAIKLEVFDSYSNKNSIYINPLYIMSIEVNPQSKTTIHLSSGRPIEVNHTIDEVLLKLEIKP